MGEMGTAHEGKPPSLPRELRTPLVLSWFGNFHDKKQIVILSGVEIFKMFESDLSDMHF
jgi:hypothetical protein